MQFWKWLANKGWSEAEKIKSEAGDKGSKVHYAVEDLLNKNVVKMDSKYTNPTTGELEELTVEEYECLMSFVGWYKDTQPEVLAVEITGFCEDLFYAGTIDIICRGKTGIWLIDLKTGQNIWPSYELQMGAYSHLDIDYKALGITEEEWKNRKLAILQVGYRRNKKRYKFTPVEDKLDVFMAAYKIWEEENKNIQPKQKDYPIELTLVKEDIKQEERVSKLEEIIKEDDIIIVKGLK